MNVSIGLLAKKVWLRQLLLLFITVSLVAWFDWLLAKSILIGGLLFLLPSIYFGLMTFRLNSDNLPRLALHNLYRGEVGKFMLTSMGFAVAFVMFKPLDIIALFSSFILMMLINLVMLSCLNEL